MLPRRIFLQGLRSRPLFTSSFTPRPCRNPRTLIQSLNTRNLASSSRCKDQKYVRFDDSPGRTTPKQSIYLDIRFKVIGTIVVLSTGYYVLHLEQVPQTGRWRFMTTSPEAEAKIGESTRMSLRQELRDQILPLNHPLTIHVRRVVSRILSHSNLGHLVDDTPTQSILSPFGFGMEDMASGNDSSRLDTDCGASEKPAYGPEKEWDVIVVNDKRIVNAMATPGMVVVYTGILPICEDEQGLAAVLSHEIGHVVARHTAERISSQAVYLAFYYVLQLFDVGGMFASLLSTYLLEYPNSRTQEREADLIGLRLMSRACYDPKAAPEMFARMGRLESKLSARLAFLNTHPSSESRVKYLEEALPEGYSILAGNVECDRLRDQYSRFRERVQEVRVDDDGGLSWA